MTRHRAGAHRRRFYDTWTAALLLSLALGASLVAAVWSYLEGR